MAGIGDEDHSKFDNDGPWPRRLLHVPTMTSYKWRPGNKYNGRKNPSYNAISYTWGRWRLENTSANSAVPSLPIKGIPWEVPRIDPSHFSVEQFRNIVHRAVQNSPPRLWIPPPKGVRQWIRRRERSPEFLWLDVACIDQRGTPEGKAEVGRQARIFRGAKSVYIWLSQTTHDDMAHLHEYLKESTYFPNSFGVFKTISQTHEWRARCPELQRKISKFVADPWFSSLWTLQEAFLCPAAVFLARDGRYVCPEKGSLFHLTSFTASMSMIRRRSTRALRLQSDTSDWLPVKDLMAQIEASGMDSLYESNPMAVLTVARFRKTSDDVDRVYGIMQVFGDECRVGEAVDGHQPGHRYTFSDLQDSFGRLLLHRFPILSQIHTHLDPPPLGKGWRICARSATPIGFRFSSDFRIHDNIKDYVGSPIVSRCKLTTKTINGLTWGHFTGKACRFDSLQRSWRGHYVSSRKANSAPMWPLQIALDSLPVLRQILPLYDRCKDMDNGAEAQHELAREIAVHFQGRELVVLLLGDRRCGDFILEYETVPAEDDFIGVILLSQINEDMQYWQRLGICQWTSYLAKHTTATAGLDKDILLTEGDQWSDMEGLFG